MSSLLLDPCIRPLGNRNYIKYQIHRQHLVIPSTKCHHPTRIKEFTKYPLAMVPQNQMCIKYHHQFRETLEALMGPIWAKR